MDLIFMRTYFKATFVFIALCITGFIFWYFPSPGKIDGELKPPVKSSIAEPATAAVGEIKAEPAQAESMTAAELAEFYGDINEIEPWNRQHGYFSPEERMAYEAYSDVTLEDLCKNNDMLALTVAAGRFVKQGNGEKAILYFWRSVAAGSTTSLGLLADMVGPLVFYNESPEEQRLIRRASSIESLAIKKVMELRGDNTPRSPGSFPLSIYESYYGPINLTADESQFINQRAQKLYDEAQAKRLEMGLGPFDNSASKIQKIMKWVDDLVKSQAGSSAKK